MEPVAVYPLMPETAHDRKSLGHLRYPAVKGGVKADHLAESRVVLGDGIDAFDLTGQVQRGQWDEASQGEHQFGRHHFRGHVSRTAMDQPVTDRIRNWKMLPLYGCHEHRLDGLFVV